MGINIGTDVGGRKELGRRRLGAQVVVPRNGSAALIRTLSTGKRMVIPNMLCSLEIYMPGQRSRCVALYANYRPQIS